MPTAFVVDDAADIRLLLRAIVSRCGYDVVEAANGVETMRRLDEVVPDLVLLDLQMPDMDGWETLDVLRRDRRTKEVPIVLCTVKSHAEDVRRGWRSGCDGFLTKPFDVGDVVRCVRDLGAASVEQRRELRRRRVAELTRLEAVE